MPRIGDKAPEFEAVTTQGPIRFPTDYAGKWIILFSHPSDFTPVCTSEFLMFGQMAPRFEALGCQLVGLSVGSILSHIAWLRAIHERIEYKGMKRIDIRFPLVADLSGDIARLYGMIHPGVNTTTAVRTLFIIDPEGTIRATICYPPALGRNFDEILRALIGLQTIDRYQIALPADWQPGEAVIAPAPDTMEAVARNMERTEQGIHCYDWFFCMQRLPDAEPERPTKKQPGPTEAQPQNP